MHAGFVPVEASHARRRACGTSGAPRRPRTPTADETTVGHGSASFEALSGDTRVVLRGSVASSHRWPTLNEMVRNFQVGAIRTLANPDLPARARAWL